MNSQKISIAMISFLSVICFCLYLNTFNNEYCLDDAMMITENSVTQKGFQGIGEHFSHGYLYGYLHREGNDAASSRWRPLALTTYSIEIGLFGKNKPFYSHLINIVLYTSIVILLFTLLNSFLIKEIYLSFFTALLFAIHPIHTEVVSNIKGRDELLCLIFLLASLHFLWKFLAKKNIILYFLSIVLFFISLTAKENGITFLAGIPIMLYFFSPLDKKSIAVYSGGFLLITLIFILLRHSIVPVSNIKTSSDVMNNPFLYAKGFEAIATKLYVLLLYLKMLVFPYPLSYDYSFNQVPFVNENNVWVWISLLIYFILSIFAFAGIKKKTIYSFSIILYFITLSISTNLLVEIGVLMGERLLFLPSVFACLFIADIGLSAIHLMARKNKLLKKFWASILILPIFIAASIVTIARNIDWKNDITLNLADVVKSPNSARVNGGAGGALIKLADLENKNPEKADSLLNASVHYSKNALEIYPGYLVALINIGCAYLRLDSLYKAEEYWNLAREKDSLNYRLKEYDHALAFSFYKKAEGYAMRNLHDSAIVELNKTIRYAYQDDSIMLPALYNLAGMYYLKGEFNSSIQTLDKLIQINPSYSNVADRYKLCVDALKKKEFP